MAAHGRVNGRGPAKLGGMSEAKVFETILVSNAIHYIGYYIDAIFFSFKSCLPSGV